MEINKFYIAGKFITPDGKEIIDLINPATEEKVGHVVSGSVKDVNDAVSAAKQAFPRCKCIVTRTEKNNLTRNY